MLIGPSLSLPLSKVGFWFAIACEDSSHPLGDTSINLLTSQPLSNVPFAFTSCTLENRVPSIKFLVIACSP